MKFGTGSKTELTQKYARVKVQNDIHMSTHIYKQISPIFNCVTPESVSLAPLANNNNNLPMVSSKPKRTTGHFHPHHQLPLHERIAKIDFLNIFTTSQSTLEGQTLYPISRERNGLVSSLRWVSQVSWNFLAGDHIIQT